MRRKRRRSCPRLCTRYNATQASAMRPAALQAAALAWLRRGTSPAASAAWRASGRAVANRSLHRAYPPPLPPPPPASLPLPSPPPQGNWAAKADSCWMAQRFKQLVVKHDEGWEFVNEGTGQVSRPPAGSLFALV